MRTELPLKEQTTEQLWIEIQKLRSEIQTHNHLSSGNSQMLTGIISGIVQSSNFETGVSGWQLKPDSCELRDVTVGGYFKLSTNDLDDVSNGTTYSRVLTTDITSGHILLSAATGDLDDISDGSSYGKVATTSITAGKIVLTSGTGVDGSLPVGNTAAKCTNASADQTQTIIDGGLITTGYITLNTAGHIKSGKTTYADATAGFWLGKDGSTPKFAIGNSTHYFKWTGTAVSIAGATLTATVLQTGTSGPNVNIESSRLAVRNGSDEVVVLEKGTHGGYIGINETDGTNSLQINTNASGDINFWLPQSNADLTIQSTNIYLTLGSGKWIAPSTGNSFYCGVTSNAWHTVTSYNFADLCSMYDEIDDVQVIKNIKPKKEKDEFGFHKMDIESLPPFLQHYDSSGDKVFRNTGRMIDICLGAIKQLDAKIEELKKQ